MSCHRARGRSALASVLSILVSALFLAGCGGTSSAASGGPARQLAALRDFQLVPGRTATLTFGVERSELKLIAELDGSGDGVPRDSLRISLERLPAADGASGEPSRVAFSVNAHPATSHTLYTGHTTAALAPGTYRLSVTGSGRLLFLGMAED